MKHLLRFKTFLIMAVMAMIGTNVWAQSETIQFSTWTPALENGVQYSAPFVKGDVSVTFAGGSNDGKYYTTGSGIRTYGDGTITIAASGNTITEVALTFSASDYAPTATTVWSSNGTGTGTSGTAATWTGSATEVVLTRPSGNGHWRLQAVEVTYESSSSDTRAATSITIDDSGITNTNLFIGTNAGSLSATVNAGGNPITGASVTWASETESVATINETTGAITLVAEGTTVITASYAGDATNYKPSTKTYTLTVTNSDPNAVDNISDITAEGSYNVRGTIVAKSQRGFVVGDGTGYVYYYNSSYDQTAYNIGDNVELSGPVVVYGGVYEFNNTTTVTAATSSNYVVEAPTVLSGADMDARVASTTAQLSNYVQYEGTLTVSGTHYNITSIEGASTAKGSISYPLNTDFTSLDGKKVKVTGYYVGVSSSQYYNTLIGSVEEIVETTPTLAVTPDVVTVPYTGGSGSFTVTPSNVENALGGYVTFYDPTNTETTVEKPEWIEISYDYSDMSLSYSITDENNTGAERTACFKYFIMCDNGGALSNLITINQAAYVAPATGDSYELYTGALTEGDYIIYYDGKAMNTTVSSDRLQYAEIEPNSDVITTSDASIVWHIAPSGEYWTIYNADANAYAASTGAKNKAQMLEDGTDDKALWTVSGTETYEFVNKQNTSNSVNANLRNNAAYGFACYGTSTGGALSLYKKVVNSTEPSIKVNPKNVDATSAETEGTITVTYVNFEPADKEIQTVAADGETSATYGWLITDFDATTGNIEYLIGENTATEARTAYLKVYALDDEANDVYSELITINQAAYVAPAPAGVWVKTDLADLTSSDVFVIVGNDGYNNAMTNDNGTSNAPAAVEVTVTGDMITSSVADNMKWNISGNATDGYTFYPNGDSEKWLYCTNTNNGVRVGTNENKNFTVSNEGYLVNSATSRYIGVYTGTSGSDWRCYTTIKNNIKDQTFSFYKFTDHLSVTVGTVGYATLYYGETNLVVPEGVEAYTYKVTDGKLDESYLYEANEVIPAGTGVVLKANAGEYKFVVTTEVGLEDPDNLLRGSDVAVTTEGPAAGDYLFYLLGVVDSKVGFYWGKEDGAAFTSGAHKAYLAVPAEQAAGVRGFTFDGTTVGISTIGVQMPEGDAYDLQGRRVQQFQKGGLYIVGGKKMLAK